MKITQELLSYVQLNVKNYEDRLLQGEKVDGPFIIEPGQHLNPDFGRPPNVGDYVHPKVIIWDPLRQHHCFKNRFICPIMTMASCPVFFALVSGKMEEVSEICHVKFIV